MTDASSAAGAAASSRHAHRPLRHAVVFRYLDVRRVERLTPHMQRVVFGGDDLRGFLSAAPDDHVKLFLPNRDGELVLPTFGADGPVFPPGREPSPSRDYTPRRFDAAAGELTIDFVLHEAGPASDWARQAAPGQTLGLGGPRGSFVVAGDFDRYVLIGDETALPAIGRWLEEMPAGVRVCARVEIPTPDDRQQLATQAELDLAWLPRDGVSAAAATRLERALEALPDLAGDTFYWIAAESHRARAMRQWLDARGVPKEWIRATGYWKADADA
ncbi:MAG TPA: siderophore-interacting protein [Dokdonella sp.]